MNPLKSVAVVVATLSLSGLTAIAQTTSGQITKIDEAAGKITLDHGPMKKFDMGAMTMVYRVKDPAMLKGLKAGDKVTFDADKVNEQFTVTRIQKAK
jgi:Cu(I)/Ag(I) efflux system periplasmic protein CusF